ncbi:MULTISPECIES: helix-turn-helix domain-containing protein [unclassified Geobacillus]|uniref:helix-turn-helix domain-containing protein n=1 Tax=unclassified Geobacillus TaxID=2642459 RepID=UPI000BE4079A|nr:MULTISPECIES: helix-turn-helix domain-containing protein [unclassified Geobacillus]PDM39300.1 excisionase [Parageobacillus yumthangensis]RDV21088.1 DNA-binding protein [Parageobacillus toebii]TXK91334.1 helix-turn-helix domain-containing protein [Parageobacillus sp. SY1]PUF87897.1 DNA-binding protein [Geobacillus sp. LYN3]TXK87990.1 helix-turn-helix domain-containing protein [Geobacillus sp. AYS3]
MTRLIDQEQENLWDSVQILSQINVEKAKSVFKVTIEKSLQQLGITSPIFSTIPLSVPNTDRLSQLRRIEKKMREAYAHQEKEKAYEYLVDYIEQLSQMAEDNPLAVRKKLLASLLAEHHKRKPKKYRLSSSSAPLLSKQVATAYYTTTEVAKKLGLSDQTIRRMCEKGKFPGAYKTDGGHWRIPQEIFITTSEQDKRTEEVLKRIDIKNQKAGDVDEFDL